MSPYIFSKSNIGCIYMYILFFSFFMVAPVVHRSSHTRGQIGAAVKASATAYGNARSSTHWKRPGIEPISSQRQCHVLYLLSHNGNSFFFFFFWLHLQHVEIFRPRIEPAAQQWLWPPQWQYQILNLPHHKGTPIHCFKRNILFHYGLFLDIEYSSLY